MTNNNKKLPKTSKSTVLEKSFRFRNKTDSPIQLESK